MANEYYSRNNIPFTNDRSNSIFTGDRDTDGTIYSIGVGRERLKVGIDFQREQELLNAIGEMQETLDNWREVLIKNGLLDIPKTAEELQAEAAAEQMQFMQKQAQEQAEINQALLKAIEGLNQKVEGLNNERDNGINNGSIGKNGHDIKTSRKTTGAGKISNSRSNKNDAANVTENHK